MDDAVHFEEKHYAGWLEGVVKDLFDINPSCISMQMRDITGKAFSCYWNCSADDRAVMVDAMKQDGMLEWVRLNRREILDILNEEDADDGLCEADTEADSEE